MLRAELSEYRVYAAAKYGDNIVLRGTHRVNIDLVGNTRRRA